MSESTGQAIAAADSQALCNEVSCTNDGTRISNGGSWSGAGGSSDETSPTAEPRQLAECVYISVICLPCECVRLALQEEPKRTMIECPACGGLSFWYLLGRGATVRPLPFYQRMRLGEDRQRKSRVPWTEYDTYESPAKQRDDRETREEEADDEI